MAFVNEAERRAAAAIGKLVFGNPFVEERITLERELLQDAFVPGQSVWSLDPTLPFENPNVLAVNAMAEALVKKASARLSKSAALSDADRRLYEGLALYVLYYRIEDPLYRLIAEPTRLGAHPGITEIWTGFEKAFAELFGIAGCAGLVEETPEQLFALFYQHRRAFQLTFRHIFGSSKPAAALRAAVWQSIFTYDMERYRRVLYGRMHEIATLITGPSGTGKELVAQAIGLSRFIPFDGRAGRFVADARETFQPLNLAALSPTLIESELFGHRKGAFTGAIQNRGGYLDREEPWATVFLDEIGETDAAVQLKLLRVLQTREFQRLGENEARRFGGKIIAATNVSLADEISAGRFRADLYYRLCSDLVSMPSLAEQIVAEPSELASLVTLVAQRLLGEGEGAAVATEVTSYIEAELGLDYPWPGNMRELEQCVRNVVVRRQYRPPQANADPSADAGPMTALAQGLAAANLSAEAVLSRYCTLVYARAGSYEAAARILQLDRRTVKQKVDTGLLAAVRGRGESR
jgi:transcriptional regulator with AAA-type ATPase domain